MIRFTVDVTPRVKEAVIADFKEKIISTLDDSKKNRAVYSAYRRFLKKCENEVTDYSGAPDHVKAAESAESAA